MVKQLILDIGNSASKIIVFERQSIVHSAIADRIDPKIFHELLSAHSPQHILLSASGNVSQDLLDAVNRADGLIFGQKTKLPIHISYETPETLGRDRIANAIAAHVLKKTKSAAQLAIDIGTCITFDLINKEGAYLGGAISPGWAMRLKAMHNYTAALPLVEQISTERTHGTDTKSSLQTGVFLGILHEIEGMISMYRDQYSELETHLTGGDSDHFEKALNCTIFADRNLTAKGLNEILLYNCA